MKILLSLLIVVCLEATTIHKHGIPTTCEVLPDNDATIISFSNGIVFDTRDGEPNLPNNLRISGYQDVGYYMIQFKGPIYDSWIEELKMEGIEIVCYIPKYTVLVHASREEIVYTETKPFVNWVGLFQPAYKLQSELMNAQGMERVTIQLFPGENTTDIATRIREMGFDIVEIIDHHLCKTIDAVIDLEQVSDIAHFSGVLWIQSWSAPTFCNYNCQWVTQTGWRSSVPSDPAARRIWFEGITGNGIVLSTTDSGISTSHQQFYDSGVSISAPGVFPTHRKVVAYKLYQGAAFGDNPYNFYHGTHVNCTVAGNDTLLGSSLYDGLAKEAKIYFVDIADASGSLVVPANLTAMYDTIYLGRGLGYTILQHSGSWGAYNTTGTYRTQDATTDAYVWAHRDFLNIYAAGNESSGYRVRNPGIAKNVLTLGATLNSTNSNGIASFSSRGPTQDNRIKPNIMAPGDGLTLWSGLISANGATTNEYIGMYGTSMATPSANGAIGLLRQYLLAGYYPSGTADPVDSISYQSAALIRAMAIVSCDPNVGSWFVPDYNIGWGRIDVDSVLYFTGDTRKLIIIDDTIGIATSQSITDSFMVNSAIPLRVCLAWTDTAAAAFANPTLVNDLNLEITAPSGTHYRGNIYGSGQSVADPLTWDNINVEECCRVNNPEAGVWHIMITGQNVPFGPQPFAYAITGDVDANIHGIEENNTMPVEFSKIDFGQSITRNQLDFEIILSSSVQVQARIYDLAGRVVHDIINRRLARGPHRIEQTFDLPSGVYFVKIDAGALQRIEKILVIK